ncbi:MAG: ribose 5-phosphate isomerase B [Dehalococcoidia bacterium]
MRIAVGVDHAGFPLKELVIAELRRLEHAVLDLGTYSTDPVDYPDYAEAVADTVVRGEADRGLLVCGSGVGASVAANKIHGIRACLCHDTFSARQGVEDDDMNILCLGARIVGPELAREIVRAWQAASFSNAERHARRLAKVRLIEERYVLRR